MKHEYYAIINNEEVKNTPRLEIMSPVTLEPIGTVSALTPELVDQAFKAARAAQLDWASQTLDQRINILQKWADLLLQNREQFATLMMGEIAKRHSDALGEVERTVKYMEETFLEAKAITPLEMIPNDRKHGIFSRVPKGVGLDIAPFNYPLNLAMSKIVPALVMGDTIVFKPPTAGSLTGSFLGKLAVEAGIPAGVFNVVTGRGSQIGDFITQNPEINFLSFTGSVPVGKHIAQISSSKDIILELGGKDAALVFDDVNLEHTADEIIAGAFAYSGQRCTAIKRVILSNELADKLVPLLKTRIEALSVGLPQDDAFITPLIDLKSADYVQSLIDDALAKNGQLITGNKRDKNLLWPTLIDHVSLDSNLAWEEPFGPVLPIIREDDLNRQIQIVNDSEFGLQASIFTNDEVLGLKVASQLEVGTVNLNGKTQRGPDIFPFLGVKDSGLGVQGIGESLKSVTRIKGIVINK